VGSYSRNRNIGKVSIKQTPRNENRPGVPEYAYETIINKAYHYTMWTLSLTLAVIQLILVCKYDVVADISIPGYDLPVTPTNVDSSYDPAKPIPLDVYMTMKDPSHIDDDFMPFIKNNADCKFHMNGDDGMDSFMNHEFAGTSIAWAYGIINPKLMASKADIWRMAVLWYYGGVYMDADSFVNTKLSQIIQPTDRFLFGAEKNAFHDCYCPQYHLNNTNTTFFAEGKQLVNWLLMSSPRHPFVTQNLHNLVMLVKRQFFEEKYLYEITREPFFKIICTTGPGLMTSSVAEVLSNSSKVANVQQALKVSNEYVLTNLLVLNNNNNNIASSLPNAFFQVNFVCIVCSGLIRGAFSNIVILGRTGRHTADSSRRGVTGKQTSSIPTSRITRRSWPKVVSFSAPTRKM
jgi:hypothetical protein